MIDFIKIPEKFKNVLVKKPKIKKKIEKTTKTKLKIGEYIEIKGNGLDIFIAKNILKAFGRGFNVDDALRLTEDDYALEIIDLTDFISSENRLKVISGRIIGTNGKTKKFIEKYTNTKIAVSGKTVSIIGRWDDIALAREAILMMIRGSAHKNLYNWLEQKAKVVEW